VNALAQSDAGPTRTRSPGTRRSTADRAGAGTAAGGDVFEPAMAPAAVPPLSVLDLAPVGDGSTPAEALAGSVELARLAERLGYRRLWMAEHHNMPGIASSSPPVMIAHLAASTSTVRVGAGGVMLPNHAPLVVAEQFGTLEALHPGRIDLGIGRAPGTDPVTAAALRRRPSALAVDDFPEQLRDLLSFFAGTHPHIEAVPGRGYRPAVSMLGSSDYSAQVAGLLGMPFSFANHFAAANTLPALAAYRQAFQPGDLDRPYVMLGVPVVCAETTERAQWLAGPSSLSFVRLRQGRPSRLPTPEEAAATELAPLERELVRSWTAPLVVGDPPTVRAGLADLAARTGADELMVTTMVHGTADRLRSYELVADACGLGGEAPAPAA
jgi:luciferase family oxidoreductase group 1